MARLRGKVAIVAGAGSGMGRATAALFTEHGPAWSASTSADGTGCRGRPGDAVIACPADGPTADEVKAILATATDSFGRLDTVVNNGCITGSHRLLEETDDETIDRLHPVNLRSVVLAMEYAMPLLRDNGAVRS